jgi:hypothetical protein
VDLRSPNYHQAIAWDLLYITAGGAEQVNLFRLNAIAAKVSSFEKA